MINDSSDIIVNEEDRFYIGGDEYLSQHVAVLPGVFHLQKGGFLRDARIGFKTWGQLNKQGDNVLVICHALTGHADASKWWGDVLGPGMPFNTDNYLVYCANMLGSPYGSSSPITNNPETGQPYATEFPVVTVRDSVILHQRILRNVIGATSVIAVVGASLGGMQALEWVSLFNNKLSTFRVKSAVCIGTCSRPSAWCLAFNEVQRQAIRNDSNFYGGRYAAEGVSPVRGLATARAIGMISYRSQISMERNFGRLLQPPADDNSRFSGLAVEGEPYFFAIQSYLRYQGRKLSDRFDANCYLQLLQMVDLHDIAADRVKMSTKNGSSIHKLADPTLNDLSDECHLSALAAITQSVLCIGIDSDVLYPPTEQISLASNLPHGEYVEIHGRDGHDALFIETAQLCTLLSSFFQKIEDEA